MKQASDKLIIVTGGAGFIGSCVVRQLNDQGLDNIVIVDDLQFGEQWKNLVGKRFVDVLHKDNFFNWLKEHGSRVEAIIHLGACSSTLETDANYLLENNYRYSVRVAEFALQNNIRFIYASSAATYGDGEAGFSDAHERLGDLRPLNMYGYSKHLFDLWVERQGCLNQVVGLKYFNVYGPNEYHKGRMSSAIVRMLPDVMQKGFISLFKSDQPDLFADGEQKRDFIYVKDAVRMTCAFLQTTASGIFNIGGGEAISWNRLAGAVFLAVNKPISIHYIDMPGDLKGKYQNFTEADMAKARDVLGPLANPTACEAAVADYVQQFLLQGSRW